MGMREKIVQTLADKLWEANQSKIPVETLTDEVPDLTIEEAYHIQRQNVERKKRLGCKVVGKKIGLTSKPMQELLGVNEPDYGILLDDMMYPDKGNIPAHELLQPKVEGEIAFVLKRDISGPRATVHDVLKATDYIVPALEIIDSRIRDWKITLTDTVADNASSGLFVLGERALLPTELDMRLVGMVLMHNDMLVNTSAGAAALGNPALCVAWLANKLYEHGEQLRAGEVVLSGALSVAVSIQKGDRIEALFDRLGPVRAFII